MATVVVMLGASVSLSFVHPWGDIRNRDSRSPILEGGVIPANVRSTIEAKCADCHSSRTDWPIYSRLAPASWLLERDVHDAREVLNFSRWSAISARDQIAALTRIAAEVRSGQMPPRTYAFMHPSHRLTISDKQQIADWARAERKRLRALMIEQEFNEP